MLMVDFMPRAAGRELDIEDEVKVEGSSVPFSLLRTSVVAHRRASRFEKSSRSFYLYLVD